MCLKFSCCFYYIGLFEIILFCGVKKLFDYNWLAKEKSSVATVLLLSRVYFDDLYFLLEKRLNQEIVIKLTTFLDYVVRG